jgi:putative phosphoesterase
MPRFGSTLPGELCRVFAQAQVDRILHLGDFTGAEVPALFEAIAPFDAVAGNNDPPALWERFGRKKIVECGGVRIGMIHGDGFKKSTLERAVDAFDSEAVDVILFGHSHNPYCARHGGRWIVNPGSPTDKRRNPQYSYATLGISGGTVTPSLHYFDR